MSGLLTRVGRVQGGVSLLRDVPNVNDRSTTLLPKRVKSVSLFGGPGRLTTCFNLSPARQRSKSFEKAGGGLSGHNSPCTETTLRVKIIGSVYGHKGSSTTGPMLLDCCRGGYGGGPTGITRTTSVRGLIFVIFTILHSRGPFRLGAPRRRTIRRKFMGTT